VRPRTVALTLTLALVTLVGPTATATTQLGPGEASRTAPQPHRVLAISVDGLNAAAIRRLGADGAPTIHRLLAEGAGTLNARTAYEQNVTLPNHTGMMTGRRIDRARGGHGVTWNDDRSGTTVQRAAGHRVSSVFNVVHAAGGTTALFSTKSKFALFERSWPRSIDRFVADENQTRLVRQARVDLRSAGRAFTFVHVSLPDHAGHEYGGMSARYLDAVRRTDRHLGTLLAVIDASPRLSRSTTVILTADHGFASGSKSHSQPVLANYRIPFVAWGVGVEHGNLYALNPDYRKPGRERPTYAATRQPVRNGDLGNLALDLLRLRSIPGSEFNADLSLDTD
jgi:predicted AlkP superfamily pyrophosphatase or phosphodiesterase